MLIKVLKVLKHIKNKVWKWQNCIFSYTYAQLYVCLHQSEASNLAAVDLLYQVTAETCLNYIEGLSQLTSAASEDIACILNHYYTM